MAGFALIDALPDFGAPRRPQPRPAEVLHVATASAPPPPEPKIEMVPRAEMDRAVAEACAALEARLSAEHAASTEAAAAAHQEALETQRRELGEQAAARIAQAMARLEEEVSARTSSVVASILGVALSEQVTREAVDALAQAVKAAVGDRETVRISVRGPLSLIEALRLALGQLAERADFVEAPGLDVSVAVDSTLLETRIAEWSTALAEALAVTRT